MFFLYISKGYIKNGVEEHVFVEVGLGPLCCVGFLGLGFVEEHVFAEVGLGHEAHYGY